MMTQALRVLCAAILACFAYQYLSWGSRVNAQVQPESDLNSMEPLLTSVDASSLMSISAHAVISEDEHTDSDDRDFGSLLHPSAVLTPTVNAPSGSPSKNLFDAVKSVKKSSGMEFSKTGNIKIEPSAVLSSSEGSVTSMKVKDVKPVFPFLNMNGLGNLGNGGGPPQGVCGGPPQGGCGGPPQGGCGGPPQGGCGGPPQGGCGGPPQGGCGGPPQGGCGGPPQGGCGGPPQGANGFGFYGNNMQHEQSVLPERSTAFTSSAAASFRTELLTEPGKPLAHMPFGEEVKPLSNEVFVSPLVTPLDKLKIDGTSVWCWGTNHTNRLCRFRNLCYLSELDDFVFFHSEQSTISGVPQKRFDPALLDLTSVEDHNALYFNYVDMPIDALSSFDISYDETQTLMFSRFLNKNIMHVFHDDLIPIFHTLLMITNNDISAIRDIQLLLFDDLEDGEFFSLYKLMSKREILTRLSLHAGKKNICFKDIYVGLSKMTLWYQYGYRVPQGPIPNFKAATGIVRKFTNYFHELLAPKGDDFGNLMGDYFVLFVRRDNRRITNEEKLVMGVANHLQVRVRAVSLEDQQPAEIIDLLTKAKGAFGMHGSLLILSMFLPPGSVFVEFFPYGVNASQYTPFRTMARIPGVDLVYRAWRNRNKTRSVTFPDRTPEMGGIRHLPKEVQKTIEEAEEVPPHLCCKDSHWLYRIYQDTSVNVKTVLRLLDSARNESANYYKSLQGGQRIRHLFPGKVENLACEVQNEDSEKVKLNLFWKEPQNVKYFRQTDLHVKYEVWIQEAGQEGYKAWIIYGANKYSFTGFHDVKYQIWVRAYVNDMIGPFNDAYACGE